MKQTNIDLAEAVEAARAAISPYRPRGFECLCGDAFGGHVTLGECARAYQTHQASQAVTAALPHIERQVREQVAWEIEDLEHDRDEMRERLAQGLSATWVAGYDNAVHDAARIARGEQP